MTDYNFEPRHHEIAHHIISGFFNSGIIQVIKVLCQFASVVVLSRLLLPTDFGVMAMASPVYYFVTLFLDLGLGQATVQKPGLTHDEVNAFFWINVAVGIGLTLLLIALSPIAGWYFRDPRVTGLTAAMSALIFLSAFGNMPGAIMRRRMEFGILALNDVIGTLSGLAASIICAVFIKGYWSLYIGTMVGTMIPVIGIWVASGWKPTWPRYVSGLRDLLKFGASLTFVGFMGFLSNTMDNILIGRRWGDDALGLYDRAYKLLLFPLQRIVGPIGGTMVPVLSRLTHEPERYRSIFLRTLAQLALITWPGILWTIVMGDPLIPTLLGEKWSNSIPIFEPLAMACVLFVVNSTGGWLMVTYRRTATYTRWGVIGAASNIAAFVIGLPYGPVGVATGLFTAELIRTPFYWWDITREGTIRLTDIIRAILPQTLGGGASFLALWAVRAILAENLSIIPLACGCVLSYLATVLVMLLFADGRETLKQSMHAAHRMVRHVTTKFGKQT